MVGTFPRHGSNLWLALGLVALVAGFAAGVFPFSLLWAAVGALTFYVSEYGFHRFGFHAEPSRFAFVRKLQHRLHYDHHADVTNAIAAAPFKRRLVLMPSRLPDVIPASPEHLTNVRPISYEAAGFWKLGEQGNEGEPSSAVGCPGSRSRSPSDRFAALGGGQVSAPRRTRQAC
jgi:hypothetical protein